MERIECDQIVDTFIEKLEQICRCDISKVKYRRYNINGKIVSIRCTIHPKLWYSVDLNVLQQVDYIIYIDTLHGSSDSFFMFPSEHLKKLIPMMYESDHEGQILFHFNFDEYDDCVMILKKLKKYVGVIEYYHVLDSMKSCPDFKKSIDKDTKFKII